MPRFLVESSLTVTPEVFDGACERARRTAAADDRVEYVRTTFLPGGTAVLHLFDAPSEHALAAAGRRAGLPFERIVETDADTNADTHTEQRRPA